MEIFADIVRENYYVCVAIGKNKLGMQTDNGNAIQRSEYSEHYIKVFSLFYFLFISNKATLLIEIFQVHLQNSWKTF